MEEVRVEESPVEESWIQEARVEESSVQEVRVEESPALTTVHTGILSIVGSLD